MDSVRGRSWDAVLRAVSRLLDGAHADPDAIFRMVTASLSSQVAGTWIAVLMDEDPTRSLVLVHDHSNPDVVDYIRGFMADHWHPEQAPTSGLARQVIDSGEPILTPHTKLGAVLAMSSPSVRDYWRNHPPPPALSGDSMWGIVWVPIRAYGATLGAFGLGDRLPGCEVGELDRVGLQAIADRVGLALRSAQFENAAARRSDRLSAVEGIVTAMTAGTDLRATLSVILDQLIERLSVDAADILTANHDPGSLHIAASRGFYSSYPSNGGTLPADLWSSARGLEPVGDIADLDRLEHSWRRSLFAREGFRAYRGTPTVVRGKVVGVLEVFHRSELELDGESTAFVRVLAALAAIAIDREAALKSRPAAEELPQAGSRRPVPDLGRTERDVLKLVVEGHTNLEIARSSHRAEATVKSSVRQLLRKAGVRNRTELARVALREGWL